MKILAFESTCDETAVAVIEDGRKIISNEIFSQADLHAVYGGVVPEIASRCHIEAISVLTRHALEKSEINKEDIDAVAVSYAPGLIGAVLVGVNFAKSAAFALGKPLIPVHHIRGHIAANYLAYPELEPPFLCLSISGGNTLLVDVRDYTDMIILGRSRDDAAGECFDKTIKILFANLTKVNLNSSWKIHHMMTIFSQFSQIVIAVQNPCMGMRTIHRNCSIVYCLVRKPLFRN